MDAGHTKDVEMGLPVLHGRAGRPVMFAILVVATLAQAQAPRAVTATEHDAAAPPLIAFISTRDGNPEIYVLNADGSGQTRLTQTAAHESAPTWSPDGTRIAYSSFRDGDTDIYVINADGSGETRLTDAPGPDIDPKWSPDGTKIAFVSYRDGGSDPRNVYVMNADGSAQTRLTDSPADDEGHAWSPDGATIAFQSYRNGNADVYRIDADGSGETRLTDDPGFDTAPEWSPDGTRIAFRTFQVGVGTDLYAMNPDGSGKVRLTEDTSFESAPRWSPDGTRIAFESQRDGSSTPNIYVMNPDGSNETRLTADVGANTAPAWSPDGTQLAFVTGRTGSQQIAVMDADGNGQVVITSTGNNTSPDWQRSGAPSTDFDWTMPERYGDDGNGDGLIDTFPPDGNGGLVIQPDGWRVDFDASPGSACDRAQERTWLLDGVEIDPSDPRVIAMDADACTLAYRFPDEGTYPIGLEVRDVDGILVGAVTRDVPVQDWLVVSIGDSVASGEGNPDIPFLPTWQDQQCHRSALAGPARAAQALEAADPRTSVTFVHLACSGATTLAGLLGPYEGQEPAAGSVLPPQVDELVRLVGDREVDAVLVSIGANDVRFSEVVKMCLAQRDCTSNKRGSAATQFSADLDVLPTLYDRLQLALAARGVAPERVYLSEYFDPTRDDTGAYCDRTMLADADITAVLLSIGITVRNTRVLAITAKEAAWASETMMPSLNLAGAEATARHGWNRVGGIRDPYLTHGYCASDHWVVTYTESMARQENQDGSLHPNAPGHELYGQRLVEELVVDLYEAGDLDRPRVPAAGS